mgnify:CR=1 FL=1
MADDWTTGRVQDRLELAADVFAQLPGVTGPIRGS